MLPILNEEETLEYSEPPSDDPPKFNSKQNCIDLSFQLLKAIDNCLAVPRSLNEEEISTLAFFRKTAFLIYFHKNNNDLINKLVEKIEPFLQMKKNVLASDIYNTFINIIYLPKYEKNNLHIDLSSVTSTVNEKIIVKIEEIESKSESNEVEIENYLFNNNSIQKEFIYFASDFISRYINRNEFRQFKNTSEYNFIFKLQQEFKRLYNLSFSERQNEMLINHCDDILALCIHTIKQQLQLHQINYSDLSDEFRKALDNKLLKLNPFQVKDEANLLTTKEKLLGVNPAIKTGKNKNLDLKVPSTEKNKQLSLIRVVLMTLDYYENNYLGKKIADQNNVLHNQQIDTTRLDQIRKLSSTLIYTFLRKPTDNNILFQALLFEIEKTIATIRKDWSGDNSRLAGTLNYIYNKYNGSTHNSGKNSEIRDLLYNFLYSDEDGDQDESWLAMFLLDNKQETTLPLEIFLSVNLDNEDDNRRYLQQHIANQVHQKFVANYRKETDSRNSTYTNPKKLIAIENIHSELISLINADAEILDPEKIPKEINKIIENNFPVDNQTSEQGKFEKFYEDTQNYLYGLSYTGIPFKSSPGKKYDNLYDIGSSSESESESEKKKCGNSFSFFPDKKDKKPFKENSNKLIVAVLQISDYYRNTKLGQELNPKENEKTNFFKDIQKLANTLLKLSSNNSPNVGAALQHIRNTIRKIRDTFIRGDYSRLARTLEELHDKFCDDENRKYKKSYSTDNKSLPFEFSSSNLETYRRRHIVNTVQEMLGQYKTHLQQSWLARLKFTNPYKAIIIDQLHKDLEKLSGSEYMEEFDNPNQPNAIVEKLKELFLSRLSKTHGKTEIPLFSFGEFGKAKQEISEYLNSIVDTNQTHDRFLSYELTK